MNSVIYPYLNDFAFLKKVDEMNIKEQFVKIIILDWYENPITEIQGRVSAGSINLDGSSAVRRSGSITFICDDEYYNVLDVNNLISINKKVKIEIGFTNNLTYEYPRYKDYDKIWFPQGVFVIINPSIKNNNQGLSISLTIKDKMCLLNGECGGVLPASVQFHEREEEDGTITKVTYYQIIQELVSEFGGEQLGKIIINDVDTRIKKVMKWNGSSDITLGGIISNKVAEDVRRNPRTDSPPWEETIDLKEEKDASGTLKSISVYGFAAYPEDFTIIVYDDKEEVIDSGTPKTPYANQNQENYQPNYFIANIEISKDPNRVVLKANDDAVSKNSNDLTINVAIQRDKSMSFEQQEDVGYIYTDFCPTSDLIGNAGQTVVNILDTIKKQLGNYEYFYDINGNFVFQEIRNYLNTSQSTSEFKRLQDQKENAYLFKPNDGKSVYTFDNSVLVTSYQNTPSYANVKNDYIVWGVRETASGAKLPIRYHLALDTKPRVGNEYEYSLNEEGDVIVRYTIMPLKIQQNAPQNMRNDNISLEKGKYKIFCSDFTNFSSITLINSIDSEEDDEVGKIDSSFKNGVEIEISKRANQIILIGEDNWGINNITLTFIKEPKGTITTQDYRTELYFQGLIAEQNGLASNRYYTELKNEWNKIFKIEDGEDVFKYEDMSEADLDYYLDIIDSQGPTSEFNIPSIGVRSKVWSDNAVNCIFEKETPQRILIEAGTANTAKLRQEAINNAESYYQVPSSIYNALAGGGYQNSAFNAVRDILYQYTNYNESITLTSIPIYYLEPNTRITVEDEKSSIHGDYMIKSISRPLDCNGTMNITATKALERF